MLTRKESWKNITQSEEKQERLFYLYGRWQDEKEFEDFKEYEDDMKKCFENAIKGTKRPFGVKIQCSDGVLHIHVKRKGNYLQVFGKSA